MSLTNKFHEAVNNGNVQLVRIMMKDSMLVDPTFEEFKEMEKTAGSMKGRLYDIHDGREFKDKTEWNDSYMDKLMVQVIGNFSHERIAHLKEVVRYLRPIQQDLDSKPPMKRENHYSYEEQKRKDQQEGKYIGSKMAAGVAAGAVLGGAMAFGAGEAVLDGVSAGMVLGGVAVGAVAGGVIVYAVMNGGRRYE